MSNSDRLTRSEINYLKRNNGLDRIIHMSNGEIHANSGGMRIFLAKNVDTIRSDITSIRVLRSN